MSFTETTHTSWFTRMKNALWQVLIGVVLLLAALYFLFTNEGRAIQTYRSLVEGAGLVVSIDSAKIDPANEGKLVHITGPVKALGTVSDSDLGVDAEGALAITRDVEMYQWVEKSESKTEKNVGGSEETTTVYSYAKEWRTTPVDSSDFKVPTGHQNPPFAIEDNETVVDAASVGAFTIDGKRVAALANEQRIAMTEGDAIRIAEVIATTKPVKINQGDLYIGISSTSPQIGDMRVRFERSDLSEASFVGAQKGDTIENFKSSNGRGILLSAPGAKDAAAMFEQAQAENTMITWLIRAGGLLALFIGFKMLFGFLGVIGDIIPFVGSIVRGGTTLIALVLTLIIGPVVIAVGWFAYRPLLAIGIIAGGLVLAVLFAWMRRSKAAAEPAATNPTFGRG
ncbi:TMEM43 family protein [Rhizobium alvei]|uniref:TMEM43 family protein n=1 Tax=Rhizobium alvei TaxID=1132659 RepID=A0ABT8YF45_9HYPH|nr:TMEM43 family protein [Rhizobium alvei]MDO6962339.1 TMEM43 family protein [Rhizobium alvei]